MSSFNAKTLRQLGLLLVAFALMVPGLYGSILTPGDTAPPDVFPPPAGALLASTTGTITSATFTVTYTEWVFADSANTFCAGCLDFVYQFTNNGPGVNERYTGYNFTGFKVDVGYVPGTGSIAGPPDTVDRSSNGAVVGFNYVGPDTIEAGQTTPWLVVMTNATQWVPGLVSAQDGSAGTAVGFGPAVPSAPEPASLPLLGSGLLLMGGFVRRFRK